MSNTNKLDSLEILRGIAAILVCFCHLSAPILFDNNFFQKIFQFFYKYGEQGVEIFFVVSGFIIPLSLSKVQYTSDNFFIFLLKRAARLHPPYIVALLITLAISSFSYKIRHLNDPENTISILKSFFYLHIPNANPVFWTLAIEIQYYIFISICYFIIANRPNLWALVITPLVVTLGQTEITQYIGLFSYIIFFLLGTTGYMIFNKVGSYFINVLLLIILLVTSFNINHTPEFIASAFTITFILLYRSNFHKLALLPGKISYSLYLIHFPIGVKALNLSTKFINPEYSYLLFIATFILTIIISIVFYIYIEKPSIRLSNNIKYIKTSTSKPEKDNRTVHTTSPKEIYNIPNRL